MEASSIILGVDPGTRLMGYGLLRSMGRSVEYLDMGVWDLRGDDSPYGKLAAIHAAVSQLCAGSHPDILAIESPFYGKNAQVVFKLGRAQGAAIVAALACGVREVAEYAPREAKEVVAGNGAASKEQVALLLQKTLRVDLQATHLDATDALAIALCHHYRMSSPLSRGAASGAGGWAQFLKAHPDRVL